MSPDISREDVQTMKSVAEDAAEEGDDVAPEEVALCANTDIDDTAVATVIAAKVMNKRPPEWAYRQYIIQAGGDDQ